MRGAEAHYPHENACLSDIVTSAEHLHVLPCHSRGMVWRRAAMIRSWRLVLDQDVWVGEDPRDRRVSVGRAQGERGRITCHASDQPPGRHLACLPVQRPLMPLGEIPDGRPALRRCRSQALEREEPSPSHFPGPGLGEEKFARTRDVHKFTHVDHGGCDEVVQSSDDWPRDRASVGP